RRVDRRGGAGGGDGGVGPRPGDEHAPAPDADGDDHGGRGATARQRHALLQAAAEVTVYRSAGRLPNAAFTSGMVSTTSAQMPTGSPISQAGPHGSRARTAAAVAQPDELRRSMLTAPMIINGPRIRPSTMNGKALTHSDVLGPTRNS